MSSCQVNLSRRVRHNTGEKPFFVGSTDKAAASSAGSRIDIRLREFILLVVRHAVSDTEGEKVLAELVEQRIARLREVPEQFFQNSFDCK